MLSAPDWPWPSVISKPSPPTTAVDGKIALDGDHVFALVQSYVTEAVSAKKFESHRKYIDVQYLFQGEEIIRYAPIEQLTLSTPYNVEKDFMLYDLIPHDTSLLLRVGQFAIFYPEDGHVPGCLVTSPAPVRKVVLKVAV